MNSLAIFVPTYKRPHALHDLAASVEQNTKHSFTLYFGLEVDDLDGQMAAISTGHQAIVNKYEPGYSNTIQTIYEASSEPFILHANDDFVFHKDWDATPMAMFERQDLMVVGLKQTEGDTHGSAISLFRRAYIYEQSGVVDMPDRVFYPYHHNYVDTEFTQTAQARGVWAQCDPRVITHLHPGFTGLDKDATNIKNDATVELDRETFESRRHLWR